MFTCPDKEIHSVYLDGELPPSLVSIYEAHVASCEKCKAQLESLRKVHEALETDARSITLDRAHIEQGWERLMARRHFRDVTRKSRSVVWSTGGSGKIARGVWRVLPAMAAAAVAAVILPIRMRAGAKTETAAGAQNNSGNAFVASAQMPLPQFDRAGYRGISGGAGAFGGGMNAPQVLAQDASVASPNIAQMERGAAGEGPQVNFSHHGRGAGLGRGHGFGREQVFDNEAVDIGMVDAFRPNLGEDEGKTITIRISVPGITGERAYTTIRVPVDDLNTAGE